MASMRSSRRSTAAVAAVALLAALSLSLGTAFVAPSVPAPAKRTALCAGTATTETESSVSAASLNLAKNLVGSGILSLPAGVAAFASTPAALGPSLLLLVLSALISAYTFYLIGRVCQETKASSFGGAWANSVRGGKWIPQWVCIFECFGGAVVYAMVLGDVFSSLLQGMNFVPALLARRCVVIIATSVAVLFPLCCLRSFAQLAKFSLLGTLATSYVVVFVVKRFLDGSYAPGGAFAHQAAPAMAAASQSLVNPQMLVLVALLSTAFLVHFNAPQFFVEMPPAEPASDAEAKEKLQKFGKVAIIGFGIASAQYALVMAFGFLTFGKAATGNVLLNYDNLDPWAAAARVAVGLSTLFGYPMQFAGFRDGILEVFKIDALKTGPHRLATASLLGVAVGVACVFRDLGQFQAIEGAMLAAFLIFAAGPIMALKLPMGKAPAARLRFRGLLVLGVAFMCIGCAVNFGWL